MILDPTTVLYVEDMEEDIFFMDRAFQMAGVPFKMQTVTTGHDAIRYLSGEEPYSNRELHPMPFLILLDLKMPDMGGLEVLGWIRSQPLFEGLLVYILSSSTRPQDREEALRLGANDFWVKKPSFSELIQRVRRLVSLLPRSEKSVA